MVKSLRFGMLSSKFPLKHMNLKQWEYCISQKYIYMQELHCFASTDFTSVLHIHKIIWSLHCNYRKMQRKFKDELQLCF